VEEYEKVVGLYKDYVKVYAKKPRAAISHYRIADIYHTQNNYEGAVKEYMAVSQQYQETKYKELGAYNAIVAAQQLLDQAKLKKKEAESQTGLEN
jgi:hypothetical protein